MTKALPNITLAQCIAAISWVATQIFTMGLASQGTTKLIISVGSSVVTTGWFVADAIIRYGRNNARAAALAAGKPDPALEPAPTGTTKLAPTNLP